MDKKNLPVIERTVPLFGKPETVKRHYNIVLLGDGYMKDQLCDFAAHARQVADAIVAEPPFDRLRSAINIFRMDVASVDSWDSPGLREWVRQHKVAFDAEPDKTKKEKIRREMYCQAPATNTAFGARFCRGNEPRAVAGDDELAIRVACSNPLFGPHVHAVLVIVNTAIFNGGFHTKVAWTSLRDLTTTALHELGHGFGLLDEYHYDAEPEEHAPFNSAAPRAPNVSATFHPKYTPWPQLLTPGVALPTTVEHKQNECPKLTPGQEENGTFDLKPSQSPTSIGAFEGALHRLCGIFRPALNCKMRANKFEFCAVCQQVIVEELCTGLFGKARTGGERVVDVGTHLAVIAPPDLTSDPDFVVYDMMTGNYAIYPCEPFVTSLLTPRPARGAIAAFWTSLVGVVHQGLPHVLAVQSGTGAMALYELAADGSSLSFVHGTEFPGLGPSLTFGQLQVTPFTFQDQLHFIEYDILTGQATVKRVDVAQPDPVTVRTLPLGPGRIGFTPFMPVEELDSLHFFSYDLVSGALELHRIDGDDLTSVWTSTTLLSPGWSDIVPFTLDDGTVFLLLHSRLQGKLRFFRVRNDGKGLEYAYQDDKVVGPFIFAPFRLQDKHTYYLRYRWAILAGQQAKVEALHAD